MNHGRLVKLLVGAATLLGVSALAVAGVSAAAAPPGGALSQRTGVNQGAPQQATGTYSGVVKSNTSAGLVAHDNQGDRTLLVQQGATVMRNGKAVAVSDLKPGDKFSAVLGPTGVVTRIDATTSSSHSYLYWLIPVLVVIALALLGLLAWLMTHRREGFLLERRGGHQRTL